ncbi:hypothetical protein GWI33_012814 [Rhynchophorus ferrugineus]|uniref:Uncharacterized protein n=1 Tax=Rhynchophorus ferrugineus TaxID=354439 RepID=A0A834I4Y6_RHYFE|nr:hypothetical protein GWI33_012814 [Rhynchophorus ferrugineus]
MDTSRPILVRVTDVNTQNATECSKQNQGEQCTKIALIKTGRTAASLRIHVLKSRKSRWTAEEKREATLT